MEKKLILGTYLWEDIDPEAEVLMIKKAGFDGFFSDTNAINIIPLYAELAKREGLIYQSHHAPFGDMYIIWEGSDEEALPVLDELKNNIDVCAENHVPIVIFHVIIGMDRHNPNEIGAERFRQLALYAREKGVKVAFENTEGEEYLSCIMDVCKDLDNVGFCFDSGHEKCYNHDHDMLALYGDRLIATHLNDNLGMKDEKIMTWHDDLHLLPFDGNADWKNIVERLKKSTCPECLTFELVTKNKPGRNEHDIYSKLTRQEYLNEAYKRACRVKELF